MSIKIFNRNKKSTTNQESSSYTNVGSYNINTFGGGLATVTLTGDVVDERAILNGTQLILDTHIGDSVVTWENCSTNLQSRINSGGGGGGTGEGLAFISTGWTTTQIEHLITDQDDPKTPVLMVQDTTVQGQDDYFWLDDAYVDASESWYTFRNGRGDTWKITSDTGDPDGTWAYHEGITINDNTNTTGYNFIAGANITLTENNNSIIISSVGGGTATTEIEYIDNTSSTQDIDIILAGGKLPVFKDNYGKLYYYDTTEEILQHTQHYFISGSGDIWWIDTNDDWWYDNSINARTVSLNDSQSYSNFPDGNLRLIAGTGISIANGSSGGYNGIVISSGGNKYTQVEYHDNVSGNTYKHLKPDKVNTVFDPTDADNLYDTSMDISAWNAYADANNIPRDFVSGLATGKYNGIEFGDNGYYALGARTVIMLKGIYTFTGMVTIPFTFTIDGHDYGPIDVDIYTMQLQYYDFDSQAMMCYNIQFIKWVDTYTQNARVDRTNIVIKGSIGFEPDL